MLPLTKDAWRTLLTTEGAPMPRLGIGLLRPREPDLADFEAVAGIARLIVVGGHVDGRDCVATPQPEERLVEMLKSAEIDGIVRMDVDAIALRNAYRRQFGIERVNRGSIVIAEVSGARGAGREKRCAMLYPISAEEGATEEARLEGLLQACDELRGLGITAPRVGLHSTARRRTADASGNTSLRASSDEADRISEALVARGFAAASYGIEVESAFLECDIVSPHRGDLGNILYRGLTMFGNGEEMASLAFVPEPYVGGSHATGSLELRVRMAAAKFHRAARARRDPGVTLPPSEA